MRLLSFHISALSSSFIVGHILLLRPNCLFLLFELIFQFLNYHFHTFTEIISRYIVFGGANDSVHSGIMELLLLGNPFFIFLGLFDISVHIIAYRLEILLCLFSSSFCLFDFSQELSGFALWVLKFGGRFGLHFLVAVGFLLFVIIKDDSWVI